jgi:hypothetical protein
LIAIGVFPEAPLSRVFAVFVAVPLLFIPTPSTRAAQGGYPGPRQSRDGVRLEWFGVEAPLLVAARRAWTHFGSIIKVLYTMMIDPK